MALVTWDAIRDFEALRNEVERAFDLFGDRGRWDRPFSPTAFVPQGAWRMHPMLNLSEDKDNIYVEALAPGLDPEKLEVSVVENTLRIAGEKAAVKDDVKPEAYHRSERGAGRFARTITLPTLIDNDKVSAEYKHGVLYLTLPKHERAKPKQISVSVS
jgi:HSP20 family protein